MEQTFKIFVIDKQPFLTIDEDVQIGDKVIVTVNDLFPSLVVCQNEEQINLFQKSKLSMTKRYKVVSMPDTLDLDDSLLEKLNNRELPLEVYYENGVINLIDEE
jgi:hypothetical protein